MAEQTYRSKNDNFDCMNWVVVMWSRNWATWCWNFQT